MPLGRYISALTLTPRKNESCLKLEKPVFVFVFQLCKLAEFLSKRIGKSVSTSSIFYLSVVYYGVESKLERRLNRQQPESRGQGLRSQEETTLRLDPRKDLFKALRLQL